MDEGFSLGLFEFEPWAWTRGPYGIPILSPEEIAFMRSGLEFVRSLPPALQLSALLGATWLASFYELKKRERGTPESARKDEPEI